MANWNLPWFSKWNKDNPKDVYGPAILVGAAGGAVIFAVIIMMYGSLVATTSEQTGPRGTGMVKQTFNFANKPDPDIANYETEEPYAPEEGEDLAKDVYENVQVLGELTDANFNRLMAAMTQWVSPEQGCAYCHNEENLASDELYTKVVSRRMIQMTQNINENWDGHVGETGVNCYTCHRGQNVPSEIWFKLAPALEARAGWSAIQNYATDQTVSTSLPHDALEKLLLEDNEIKVHDLEPRVPSNPSDPEDRTWQDTERTYSLMNYIANSLGKNCNFCHNSRAFYDGAEVTPQWSTAYMGIDMVREMNQEYLVPLKDTYPPHRLGPKHMDAPKAACKTCHKGYNKPLNGTPMISDWPELATSGTPEYPAAD